MQPDNLKNLLIHHALNPTIVFNKEDKMECECGKLISFNGTTSHSKICSYASQLKIKYIKRRLHVEEFCPICNKQIDIFSSKRRDFLVFCSSKCSMEARKIVSKAENIFENICIICNTSFITSNKNKKTCSDECNSKNQSNICSSWHKNMKENDIEKYQERNKKISIGAKNRTDIQTPWNKGMSGDEYMSYYIKSDGTNSFYESLKKNEGWFKKTSPEIKFENKLKEIGCRYQYSFFTQNRQFDFLIALDDLIIIIEIDGDYWHKSRRLEFDEEVIQQQRLLDNEKANILKDMNFTKRLVFLRIWEYHLMFDNSNSIWIHIENLLRGIEIEENIYKIEEYYKIYY